MAMVLKTIRGGDIPRGFESHALRQTSENRFSPGLIPAKLTSGARYRPQPDAADCRQTRFTCTLTQADQPACQSCARVTIID